MFCIDERYKLLEVLHCIKVLHDCIMTNCINLMYTPHSVGTRTAVCIKNGEFAGKKTIWLCERYKVLGNATLY